ncbi:hypothetical protein Pcinc_040495 [Petrolisthes cinctipes]|uniref:Uncharacterized protein n=1 Tax=Petrolisthes cinctipes TaxID=88211 RepID=A0AAE1BLB7_PETCI|nr:hypothetical protein Pcinc_040495 [Petrolisthes cinctipes]
MLLKSRPKNQERCQVGVSCEEGIESGCTDSLVQLVEFTTGSFTRVLSPCLLLLWPPWYGGVVPPTPSPSHDFSPPLPSHPLLPDCPADLALSLTLTAHKSATAVMPVGSTKRIYKDSCRQQPIPSPHPSHSAKLAGMSAKFTGEPQCFLVVSCNTK